MADWLAGRLAGSQEAGRNEEIKVIKAIMGFGTLMPQVRGFREGKRNNRLVPSHVVRKNLNIGACT
jgi:hypothetical protein